MEKRSTKGASNNWPFNDRANSFLVWNPAPPGRRSSGAEDKVGSSSDDIRILCARMPKQREATSRYERTRESWVQHHQRQVSWSASPSVRSFRIIKTRSAAHYSDAHPLLSLSPPPLLSFSLRLASSYHPHSYSCSRYCVVLSFSFSFSFSSVNKCLFLLSAVFFFSPSLLRAFCVRFSLSFLLLFRAHLYFVPSTRFAPLVVLSCIFLLFSQFRSSSRAFSSLFHSYCLFLPLLFSSSISFFSLRALFPSHPRPVARSAGIRGIFEPVHDGRLLQGRTFIQPGSEIFGTEGLNPKNQGN